ncbi:hypothetical protein HGM15179_002225 [Zosterops borbonicus]|uniref:Uncharacterized protein n=1 Tax=Zosterops borbonicus TaxID=364589 RepID=A0A8K1GT94_9PASS|nr:hypothetical protein HGM15179_002225 [Zosterops borbonicus]
MGCQLFQECAVGDSVKGLAEVQTDIHSPSCIHQVGHLVIKGDQVGQTPPTPPKAMLAGSDPLAILSLFLLSSAGVLGSIYSALGLFQQLFLATLTALTVMN